MIVTSRQLFGALLLLAGPAAAQEANAPPLGAQARGDAIRQAEPLEKAAVTAPADMPVRLPSTPKSMPFTLQDNLVRIDAKVNGRPWSAVLDSGAGALISDQTVIRRFGLKEAGSTVDAAGAGADSKPLRPVTLADLSFGPIQFKDVASYAGDLSQLSLSARFPVDMLVGAPAFKYGAVTVDYPRRRVTFGRSGSAGNCAAPIPLEIIHDAPVVELQFRPAPDAPPVRLKMLVDLGTRHFAAAIGGPFLRTGAGQALTRSGVAREVGHGIGGKVQGTVARVTEVRLGKLDVGDLDVALSPNIPAFEAGIVDGTLGVPLWQNSVITFDYPARQLCIGIPKRP